MAALPTPGVTEDWGDDLNAAIEERTGLDSILPSYLQTANLHATYGDDFTGTSLNGRWTRRTVSSGNESWQQWRGTSGVKWGTTPAAGWMYTQPAPSGDFAVHAAFAVEYNSTTILTGPLVIDSTGAGRAAALRGTNGFSTINLSSYVYGSYGNGIDDTTVRYRRQVFALTLRKSGSNYTTSGVLCGPGAAGLAGEPFASTAAAWSPSTPDRIGFGTVFTDGGGANIWLLRFNVTS